MATSKLLMVAATLAAVLLFVGSANAHGSWPKCKPGYKNCDLSHKNGCETKVLGSDVKNCGDCGKCCAFYAHAITKCNCGKCEYSCKKFRADCDNNLKKNGCETDIGEDVKNCGKCGYCCPPKAYAIPSCKAGKCEYTCKKYWADCDKDLKKNGCETNIGKDVKNCGKCGKCCPKPTLKFAQATCRDGVCKEECIKGYKFHAGKKCCVPIH